MIVFHTSETQFSPHQFHPLSHFGSASAAYARVQSDHHAYLYMGILRLHRPLTIRDFGNESHMLAHDLHKQKILDRNTYQKIRENKPSGFNTQSLIHYLQSQGHDGLSYDNSAEDIGSTSHIIFSPQQFIPLGPPIEFTPPKISLREFTQDMNHMAQQRLTQSLTKAA